MRKNFTRLTAVIVLAVMLVLSVSSASVKSFSDVPKSYWGYETIMRMAEEGIFKGTTEPVNGVAKFSPEDDMTRAEFITASLRATFPEVAEIGNDSKVWWRKYYYFALDNDILIRGELDDGMLDKPIAREEMAMIMVRCVEAKGEKLTQRIKWNQIPDYSEIDNYFKYYVRDCYSYGLLCGIDDNGTFDPKATLTRAEAATVICRLIDEDMRIDVNLSGESSGNNNSNTGSSGNSSSGGNNTNNNGNQNKPEEEDRDPFPWEYPGAKKPSEYTWEEFEELEGDVQEGFFDWFETYDAFEAWMIKARNLVSDDVTYPWESGGKAPDKYTWEEFEALDELAQEAFYEWFSSPEAFEAWMARVNPDEDKPEQTGTYPWEKAGAKKPNQYTWEEFMSLSELEQEAFFEWFSSPEAFEAWMARVNPNDEDKPEQTGTYPWEKAGAKKPNQYTWEEFMSLSELEQEAFFEWFATPEDFEAWMERVQ